MSLFEPFRTCGIDGCTNTVTGACPVHGDSPAATKAAPHQTTKAPAKAPAKSRRR